MWFTGMDGNCWSVEGGLSGIGSGVVKTLLSVKRQKMTLKKLYCELLFNNKDLCKVNLRMTKVIALLFIALF